MKESEDKFLTLIEEITFTFNQSQNIKNLKMIRLN